MRKAAPQLLAIFRSQLQGALLARVYLSPWDGEVNISDLARGLGAPGSTVQREVSRLVASGLLVQRKRGREWLVSPPENELLTRPLTELLAVTFGPLPVLAELLAGVSGLREAFLYGSWAARYLGQPGPVPGDVDLLVVGRVNVRALREMVAPAEARLRRQVAVRRVAAAVWDGGVDPFVAEVRCGPLVQVPAGARGGSSAQVGVRPGPW